MDRQRTDAAQEVRLVLRRADGAVLLVADTRGGTWQFPAAACGGATDAVDAAARLCREALGLLPGDWVRAGALRCGTGSGRRTIEVLTARVAEDTALPLAASTVAWVAPGDLDGMPLDAASREIAMRITD